MKKILFSSILLLLSCSAVLAQIGAGKHILKLDFNMKALDADRGQMNNNGGKLQVWNTCENYKANCEPQIWEIIDAGNGYSRIKLSVNNKFLTVDDAFPVTIKTYGKVFLWEPCLVSCDKQLWKITRVAENKYIIRSFAGHVLSVQNEQATENGGSLVLATQQNSLTKTTLSDLTSSGLKNIWTTFRVGLKGIVDMHTHPMSHLGFGGKLMHGAPDEQTLMLAGSVYRGSDIGNLSNCRESLRPGSIGVALSRCDAVHGGWEGTNNCGDIIRSSTVENVDKVNRFFGFKNDGFPNFDYWPIQTSVTHQQMWYEWIRRAYDGGLRVMVSLAVHNRLLTKIINGSEFTDDKSAADLQISEMIAFVNRHNDFMEIARSPEDLTRINGQNKLAIILGIEVDDIGNFTYNRTYNSTAVNITHVKTELTRLFNMGIRYIFPIHMSNNVFGGTAVNSNEFALISKYYTNRYIEVENSCNDGIGFELGRYNGDVGVFDALRTRNVGYIIDNQPSYAAAPANCGQVNNLGLTSLGINSLLEMMKMGFIIDIDHMSRKSMKSVLALSKLFRNYPINTGHNGIGEEGGNERNLSTELVDSIFKTGGMIGIGSTDALPENFANNFMKVYNRMNYRNVAIGTDANGMEPLPRATPGLNSTAFYGGIRLPKCTTGNKTWDYTNNGPDGKGGVAHYGLMPEFFRDVSMRTNGMVVERALTNSADDFLMMWEKCIRVSTGGR